ncbi:hypothetical protein LWI28_011362 [Acer negundo]|uniref:protein-serine/threonine phosphatase n=1 Tax=Acer negundo TaxID=4023 RepID=A0AAD5ILF9_ACENE|nr:hypothetical protein LWI28_011362 [Acer negundo]
MTTSHNESVEAKMETRPTCTKTTMLCSTASLKRKRPPRIQIPNVLQEIPKDDFKFKDFTTTTTTTQHDDTVCFSGVGVAVSSLKGKKKFMEDTHKIVSCLQANSNKSFFGVYDGHGGKMAAEFVAENLHTNVFEMMKNCKGEKEKEEAVKAGYLKTDHEFLKQGLASGACCVTALIEGQEVVVSNVGDCRAVLCRGGVAEALTTDHRAEREDERKRIENQGGYVEVHRGGWRVHGILSVSRSIGDAHLKNWVVAEPDTRVVHVTSDMEFLVLASDGLWEKVSNQEAVDTVKKLLVGKALGPLRDHSKENDGDFGRVNASPSSKLRKVSSLQSPLGDLSKENEWDFGGVNVSPLSKLQRVSFVKQPKEMSQSPLGDLSKENDGEFGCVHVSPLPKLRRVSLVKQPKETSQSPLGDLSKENDGDFGCVNVSPLSKLRRVSLVKQPKETSQSPLGDLSKENEGDFTCVYASPSSKLRRVSLVKLPKETNRSPGCKKTNDNWKESEDDFVCEIATPPSKLRRISLVKGTNVKTNPSGQENSVDYKKSPASVVLMAACKELANLSVSRGCFDDITVMIIDLNHFRLTS